MALPTRLTSTCRSRVSSPSIARGIAGSTNTVSRTPLLGRHVGEHAAAPSRPVSARSIGSFSMVSLPASIFEKSRMSSMIAEQRGGRVAHQVDHLHLVGAQARLLQHVEHADHAVHRRADLVAHRGEEARLGLVGLVRLGAGTLEVRGAIGDALFEVRVEAQDLELGELLLGDVLADARRPHDLAVGRPAHRVVPADQSPLAGAGEDLVLVVPGTSDRCRAGSRRRHPARSRAG